MTDLRTYLAAKLKADGYDGLCSATCGCGADDLMPCGEPGLECQTARLVKATPAVCHSCIHRLDCGHARSGVDCFLPVTNGGGKL